MTCREFVEFLLDYLEGELPEAVRATFQAHLDVCPACVTYLDTYRETVRLGRELGRDPEGLPGDVPEALVQAILAARRTRPGP